MTAEDEKPEEGEKYRGYSHCPATPTDYLDDCGSLLVNLPAKNERRYSRVDSRERISRTTSREEGAWFKRVTGDIPPCSKGPFIMYYGRMKKLVCMRLYESGRWCLFGW